jgi:hypothetical protein
MRGYETWPLIEILNSVKQQLCLRVYFSPSHYEVFASTEDAMQHLPYFFRYAEKGA